MRRMRRPRKFATFMTSEKMTKPCGINTIQYVMFTPPPQHHTFFPRAPPLSACAAGGIPPIRYYRTAASSNSPGTAQERLEQVEQVAHRAV